MMKKKAKMWWESKKWKLPRVWDFEGRCKGCKEGRDLILKVIDNHTVQLTVDVCSEHPDDSMILWPVRDDIRRE
jgi:hypothetical protein